MKKSIVALTVVLMATLSIMTSCKKEEGLTLKDLAGYTFEGKQVGENKSEVIYTLTFDKTEQAFAFVSTLPFTSAGTYEISGTSVILKYPAGNTETLKSEGPKKLIYRVKDKDVVLTRK
jgi:hypothetical protein